MMHIAFIRLYRIACRRISFYLHAPGRREKNQSRKKKLENREKEEEREKKEKKEKKNEKRERRKRERRREKRERRERRENEELLSPLSLSEGRRKKKGKKKAKWRFAPGRVRETLFSNPRNRKLPHRREAEQSGASENTLLLA